MSVLCPTNRPPMRFSAETPTLAFWVTICDQCGTLVPQGVLRHYACDPNTPSDEIERASKIMLSVIDLDPVPDYDVYGRSVDRISGLPPVSPTWVTQYTEPTPHASTVNTNTVEEAQPPIDETNRDEPGRNETTEDQEPLTKKVRLETEPAGSTIAGPSTVTENQPPLPPSEPNIPSQSNVVNEGTPGGPLLGGLNSDNMKILADPELGGIFQAIASTSVGPGQATAVSEYASDNLSTGSDNPTEEVNEALSDLEDVIGKLD